MKTFSKFAISFLFLAGMWLYVQRVLVRYQISDAAAHNIPRGNLSDLYPSWLATRELLLGGRNPYTPELTREIQAGYYGRPLEAWRSFDPTNEQAFAYPVYVAFLLAPTIHMPFAEVRIWAFRLLLALTVLSVLLWLGVLKWQPGWSNTATIMLLMVATFAVVQGLKLQQLSLLVAALIAASVLLLACGQMVLSGVLLALATIKPQLNFALDAWLLLWAFSNLKARWRLLASFILSLGALILGGEYLLHGWMGQFYAAIVAYRNYAASGPLLDQMLGRPLGLALRIAVLVTVIIVCWKARNAPAGSDQFQLATCLVLAATLLLIPLYPPHYQLLLLPGILYIVKNRQVWNSRFAARILLAVTAAPLLWSWLSAVGLATVSFFTPAVQGFWQVPLWPTVVMPVPVTACLGLLIYRREVQDSLLFSRSKQHPVSPATAQADHC